MNAGLWYLLRASYRGFFRRTGRRLRTFRGFASTVFALLFFALLIASQVMALVVDDGRSAGDHGDTVRTASLVLTLLMLPSVATAEAPVFWPAEVQFLFPAPLRPRDLLLYQMLRSGWVQAFSGIWIGLMTMRAAVHPLLGFPAAVLSMMWIFVLAQLAGLVKLAVGDRLPPAARRAVRPGLALLAVVAGLAFYRRTQAMGFGPVVAEAFASDWMRAVTLPARPFAELFAARSGSESLAWGAACTALVVAAGAAAMAVRVDFRERSLVTSAKRFERLRRMRAARTGYASTGAPVRRRVPVPALAFLRSAAPLARRQVYELARGLRTLWGLLFSAVLAFFYVIILPHFTGGTGEGPVLGMTLVVLVIVFPMLASGGFSIDFRRDLERMPYLRSLPLRPMAVAVGQVFTAAVVIALVNVALVVAAAALADWRVEPSMAVAAAAGAVPVAWLAVALENWLFLLFPTRTQADGGQQNTFMGKQIVKLLFKLVLLGVVAGAAGLVAAGGAWLAGAWGAAAGVVVIVFLACVGATALLARAYRGFDLTVDSPA